MVHSSNPVLDNQTNKLDSSEIAVNTLLMKPFTSISPPPISPSVTNTHTTTTPNVSTPISTQPSDTYIDNTTLHHTYNYGKDNVITWIGDSKKALDVYDQKRRGDQSEVPL